MRLGEELAKARKRKGLTQEDLSLVLPVSRESVAKYETGTRKIPKDLRDDIATAVDEVEYYFVNWEDASGEVSIPYFDGENIDRHPTSMVFLAKTETVEALEHMEKACWYKPHHTLNDTEKEEIKKVLFEVLDSAASLINLVAVLCRDYGFSMKQIFKEWRLSLKMRKFES